MRRRSAARRFCRLSSLPASPCLRTFAQIAQPGQARLRRGNQLFEKHPAESAELTLASARLRWANFLHGKARTTRNRVRDIPEAPSHLKGKLARLGLNPL